MYANPVILEGETMLKPQGNHTMGKKYTVNEAARFANTTPQAIKKAAQRKTLKAEKFGRDWQIDEDDLLTWMQTHQRTRKTI